MPGSPEAARHAAVLHGPRVNSWRGLRVYAAGAFSAPRSPRREGIDMTPTAKTAGSRTSEAGWRRAAIGRTLWVLLGAPGAPGYWWPSRLTW